jgi:deoxyribodipyrimidine photo-lyase
VSKTDFQSYQSKVQNPKSKILKTVLHWFRRDLRITDNTALAAAARESDGVVPVYIQSSWEGGHRWTGSHRQQFLCGCLASLDRNLREIGSQLVIRRGDAAGELARLAEETGATAIYYNRDPDPFGRATEDRLARMGRERGIEIRDFKDICLHERDEVLTAKGEPFRVFTPYFRAWLKQEKTPPRGRLRTLGFSNVLPQSAPLPELADWKLDLPGTDLPAGERAARERLRRFLHTKAGRYSADRDMLAIEGTSRISQDLRFGLLSIREIFSLCEARAHELPAAQRMGVEKFISELAWREFYMQVLWHWPEVLEQEFDPRFRGMRWWGDPALFTRWRDAETGFPIVDAAMRELAATGHMHNRARMVVAMFLTKDLQLDWRVGEACFMQRLTDGEIASNNGGWQWSAGTGADAAPYFRIQNPWTQAARFDPEARYTKQWLPELRDLPAARILHPPEDGRSLVNGYPAPIVNHAEARERALDMFRMCG